MKYTKQQLNDMQEYLISNLNLLSQNHSYPKEERTLSLLLTLVANARVEWKEKEQVGIIFCPVVLEALVHLKI